jgi:error-prone DNA polymerase
MSTDAASGWEPALEDPARHSTRAHPLEPLRARLEAQGLPDARAVGAMRNGSRVRYAGLVICRQRPLTANGVTFMTLEDETGFVNLVLWEQVFERYDVLAKTALLLGITGKLQIEDGVAHVIVDRLWAPELGAEAVGARSHDFR